VHLVQILLPLFDNHGVALPETEYRRVSAELAERFGGVTAYMRAPAEGHWRDDEERTTRDEIVVVEVMVDALDRDWWRDYRQELERRFRQDEVVIRAQAIERL
jgi:hypothetical protein